jgi:hypothetical protein
MVSLSLQRKTKLQEILMAAVALLNEAKGKLRHDETCASLEGSECDCSLKALDDKLLQHSIETDEFLGSLEG